jgi:AraC family transcriptional regulator, positive regulator of tynA and feaB
MIVSYSTLDIHPRDRIAYWIDVACKELPRHEFRSRVGPAYEGSIKFGVLGDMSVAVVECDPCETKRRPRDLVDCRNDDFLLVLHYSGRILALQDGREALMQRDNFVLVDPARPIETVQVVKGKLAFFSIPRKGLEARMGSVGSLAFQAISKQRPLAGLAAGFLSMLPARVGVLTGSEASLVAEQALDLIALALSSEASKCGVTLSAPRAASLLRLKSVIERRLRDPELKPSTVAREAGIGVRYANALLLQEDFSIERYILHRRLERCRRALADPAQAHRMIGEIAFAWGFSDLSHFSRRFRATYGMTPSDWRAKALGETAE